MTNGPGLRQRIAKAVGAKEKISRVEEVKRIDLLDPEFSVEEDESSGNVLMER